MGRARRGRSPAGRAGAGRVRLAGCGRHPCLLHHRPRLRHLGRRASGRGRACSCSAPRPRPAWPSCRSPGTPARIPSSARPRGKRRRSGCGRSDATSRSCAVLGEATVAQTVRSATGGRGADVVVNILGGAALQENIDAAAVLGRIICLGRVSGTRGELDLDEFARKRITMTGITFRTRTVRRTASGRRPLHRRSAPRTGARARSGRSGTGPSTGRTAPKPRPSCAAGASSGRSCWR